MANGRILHSKPEGVHARSGDSDLRHFDEASVGRPLSRRSVFPSLGAKQQRELTIVGLLLALAYLVQYWLTLDWAALSSWQRSTNYKLATGSLLALFVAFQWFLAVCRWAAWSRLAKSLYRWHQLLGVLSPALLFLHSTRLGAGYLWLLTSVYLGNTVLGLVSPQTWTKLRAYHTPWMASHIALSVLLVVVMCIHTWTALYFE